MAGYLKSRQLPSKGPVITSTLGTCKQPESVIGNRKSVQLIASLLINMSSVRFMGSSQYSLPDSHMEPNIREWIDGLTFKAAPCIRLGH